MRDQHPSGRKGIRRRRIGPVRVQLPELRVLNRLPPGEVARAGLVLLGLGLTVYLLWRIGDVLLLLLLAILFATAIEPIVRFLSRGPFSRGAGILVVYLAIIVVIGVPALILAPSLIAQAVAFSSDLPGHLAAIRPVVAQIQLKPVQQVLLSALDRAIADLKTTPVIGGQQLVSAGATVAQTVFRFLLVFVIAYYWLIERLAFKRALLRIVPRRAAKNVSVVWNELEDKMGRWVRGQLVLMLAIAVMAGVCYAVIGLPTPVLLAAFAGVAEMIPIIGPYLAFAPAVLIALLTDPTRALILVAYAIAVQLIESNVLVPRVMSTAVGISPLTVIVGIEIGAILGGLPGAFLAVPISAAIQVILAHVLRQEGPAQGKAHVEAGEKG